MYESRRLGVEVGELSITISASPPSISPCRAEVASCAVFVPSPPKRALKHFRNVSKVVFCLNQKRLQGLVESGKLRAVRLGRVLRIREADYEAFLEQNLA